MANTNLTTLLSEIADALRDKGGTTDKIKATDFADAIKNLPSGESGMTETTGTFTITETSTDAMTIAHGLGKTPKYLLSYSKNGVSGGTNYNLVNCYNPIITIGTAYNYPRGSNDSFTLQTITVTDTDFTVTPSGSGFYVGQTYTWIAIG